MYTGSIPVQASTLFPVNFAINILKRATSFYKLMVHIHLFRGSFDAIDYCNFAAFRFVFYGRQTISGHSVPDLADHIDRLDSGCHLGRVYAQPI